jgi:cadmium resistance protein CadD (predicted permease)
MTPPSAFGGKQLHEVLGSSVLAIALFASTNIDDLFVLLGLFSDPRYRRSDVVLGQYAGIAILFGVSVAASLISLVLAPKYLGLLGLAPIAIGLKRLLELRGGGAEESGKAVGSGANIVAVASVTVANGGDNIGIYTPLFAIRPAADIAIIAIVFVAMTAAWLFAAYRLTVHPRLGAPIRRFGPRVVPFVLIGLGIMILAEAGTFALLG